MNKYLKLFLYASACVVVVVGGLFAFTFGFTSEEQLKRQEECRDQILPSAEQSYVDKGLRLHEVSQYFDKFDQMEYTSFTIQDESGKELPGKVLVLISGPQKCLTEERQKPL